MGLCHVPLTWRLFPLVFGSVQDQIEQLGGRLVAWEVSPGSDRAPELRVKRLDGIGCVDDPAHFVRERKERDDLSSEEHTSALQSLMRISYAVFCLKKKNQTHIIEQNHVTDRSIAPLTTTTFTYHSKAHT